MYFLSSLNNLFRCYVVHNVVVVVMENVLYVGSWGRGMGVGWMVGYDFLGMVW